MALFKKIKQNVMSIPCLKRANCLRPFFLKTDWLATSMGWVLMQAAEDDALQEALAELAAGKECRFNASQNGPWLRLVLFGAQWCKGKECNYHLMVGKAATGRVAIGKLQRYLWGTHFY